MELKAAIEHLSRVGIHQPHRDWTLFVKVFNPGSIGGTPCVAVRNITAGFDWDNGKLLIETDMPLTLLSPDDVAAIHKSSKAGQSWHAFQSYKKQADRIKALEAEVAQLKGKHP